MHFRQIKPKLNSFLLFMASMCLFLVWSCGDGKSPSEDRAFGTGALSFNVVYHDGTDADLRSETAKIDCEGQGIATVGAVVYDSEDNKEIADGGPWKCNARRGTISDVPAGSDRTVVVLGKDADETVILSGQKSGIAVTEDSENDAGTIECYAFVPNLTAPANNAVVQQGAVDLQWEEVAGATEYRVFVSQNSDMSDPVIEDHPAAANDTPSGLTSITTYYWQVFAVDRDENWGIGSQIRSLTVAGRLPDTGQISDYTDTVGEDSDYAINPHAYIKLDTSGNVLPDDADDWAMVRDDITGLTWEAKTMHDDIHNAQDTYTWQDAQNNFIAQLNNDNFGRHADWRLPTIKELFSIVHKDQSNPAVNLDYFRNIIIARPDGSRPVYWSSNTYVADPDLAWFLDFRYGDIYFGRGDDPYGDKDHDHFVIAVRGRQDNSTLVDNGDGTVTDLATGLMWQQQMADNTMAWEEALTYCEELELAGHKDWRLPNINELQSIADYRTYDPAVDVAFFPDTQSESYWSSTSYYHINDNAWDINFFSGDIWGGTANADKSNNHYVRAVRGGQ